jgi:hypothetical protein
MEKGKWYGKEGINDRKIVTPTAWLVDAGAIPGRIDFMNVVTLAPYEREKSVPSMVSMLRDRGATENLDYW